MADDYRYWTNHDVKYLQNHYGFVPVPEISEALGKSEDSIRKKASALGIRSALPRKGAQDVQEIQKHIYDGLHPSEIAEKIGTSTGALTRRVKNGKQYDPDDYRVLLLNRRRKGRMKQVKV